MVALDWEIVGVGDFDGDARSDILWRNAVTGQNYVFLMNGTAVVNEGMISTVADLDWRVAGVGDFDGDARGDILWRNATTGQNYVYLMNGLAIADANFITTVAELDWRVAGVGDFDGDGRSDVLWRNQATGQNYVYLMDGLSIENAGFIDTVAELEWRVAGVGDFDGDGRSDILWHNSATGENYLYFMDGLSITTRGFMRTVADLAWDVAALGDYDGDGRADILWRNNATGENYLFPMDGFAVEPSEGYVRAIADQNWHVVYGSPQPEEMGLMGAQTLLDEPVRYTAASVNVRQAMLSDAALSNVATFYGLNGSVNVGTFDGVALEQRAATTLAPEADASLQLAAHADGDWVIASKDDRTAAKKAFKVDWKSVLSKFGVPFLSKDKASAKASQPNFAEFKLK
jgi:hypothetical protein